MSDRDGSPDGDAALLRVRIAQLEADLRAHEQKAHERALDLARARAESARGERFVDHVLAVMSHELRTPLTTILGMTEALQDGVYGAPLPRQREGLQVLEGAGKTLLGRIDDLLDLARAGGGRLALDMAVVSVEELVQGSMKRVEQAAGKKGVVLSAAFLDDPGQVHGDERRLRRALGHLLDNAIRFTPPGGSVSVEARGEGSDARVVVADTGGGMDPAVVALALRPFDGQRSLARTGGAGIGLTVAGRIVELHGGRLEIESSPRGTSIIVTLPRVVAGSTAAALARAFRALGAPVVEHAGGERVAARAVGGDACAIVIAGDLPEPEVDQAIRDLEEHAVTRRLPRLVVDATPRPEALAAFVDGLPQPRAILVLGPRGAASTPGVDGEAPGPHRP